MRKILLVLAIAGANVTAYADGPVYIDAGIGLNTSWSSLAYNANLGVLVNKYLGVEGGLTYSSGYTYNYSGLTYNSDYFMYDVAVKGILPLTQEFALYGKLGAGFNNYSSWNGCNGCGGPSYSGTNTGLLYGAGAKLTLSRSWSLHLEDYTVTGSNPNLLMFGGEFNF